MKAVIDGDVIAFQVSFKSGDAFIPDMRDWLLFAVEAWTPPGCDPIVALSLGYSFRHWIYPKYKANRRGRALPPHLPIAFNILREELPCLSISGLEGDDIIGILGTAREDVVMVTVDKDLRQVPGFHWFPGTGDPEPTRVTPEEGYWNLCLQWLAGDRADNLPGLPGIGPKKAEAILTAAIQEENGEEPGEAVMERHVRLAYGSDISYCSKMYHCIKILQARDVPKHILDRILGDLDKLYTTR